MKVILLSITRDPLLFKIVILSLVVIASGFILKLIKQPVVIAYIAAGILLGPSGLKILVEQEAIEYAGSFGLIFLMFFIGMEISLKKLISIWEVSLSGTFFQFALSILACFLLGKYFNWSFNRILTLGIVISISSTAITVNLLKSDNQLNSDLGQKILGILIIQDILIAPILLILNLLNGEGISGIEILFQVLGIIIVSAIIFMVIRFKDWITKRFTRIMLLHEQGMFLALIICLGFSAVLGFFGLSSVLGAFIAGVLVSSLGFSQHFHDSLFSFKVLFEALFFVSVGMIIDIHFYTQNATVILILLFSTLFINTIINAFIIKASKSSWSESLYGGASLAQVGEFSFVISSIALKTEIISSYAFMICISIIASSLIISPVWLALWKLIGNNFFREKISGAS